LAAGLNSAHDRRHTGCDSSNNLPTDSMPTSQCALGSSRGPPPGLLVSKSCSGDDVSTLL
jgi:hypothetical protein